MPFAPRYDSYDLLLRYTSKPPKMEKISVKASDYLHLEDEEAFGILLAQLVIQAGLLDDPLFKNGGVRAIGVYGTNEEKNSSRALDLLYTGPGLIHPIVKGIYAEVRRAMNEKDKATRRT